MKRIGVIGGVGPYAALHFYRRLLQLSPATTDSDYPAVVLVADRVPSRVDHLLGRGADPLAALQETVRSLERAGVEVIALPSVTTHAYWSKLADSSRVPMAHLLVEAGRALAEHGYEQPFILATEATATLRLFEPYLRGEGHAVHYPNATEQLVVSGFIDRVKRGEPADDLRRELTEWLRHTLPPPAGLRRGTAAAPDCVVLGCTELSLIAPHEPVGYPVVDVTDVLASSVLDGRHGRSTHNDVEAIR